MISNQYKFIYVAIPKCGSRSIVRALDSYWDIRGDDDQSSLINHHANFERIKKYIESAGLDWHGYFRFTSVRNPWERLVSAFFHVLKQKSLRRHDFSEWKGSTFRDFIIGKGGVCIDKSFAYKSQISYFLDSDAKILSDAICRLETLQQDFNAVCDKIGIPRQKLPHVNKTKHKHYSEYYDDETREIVAKRYAKDIEYLGYKFED